MTTLMCPKGFYFKALSLGLRPLDVLCFFFVSSSMISLCFGLRLGYCICNLMIGSYDFIVRV